MPNGGKSGKAGSGSAGKKRFTWPKWSLRTISLKKVPEVSMPFALLVTSLVFLIGFVAVLAQQLKTEDFLYQQFDRSYGQVETLQIKIDGLREENARQQRWLDNLNIRIEYYAPPNQQ
ncbi:hypothetical protein KJ611_03510 [Patescibacteria group bacterium]|nr:hypothetical protein [Patescibacteria group bacterium]MBU1705435.1 hypothetical protein [Patescibacteria group bacterium]